jgi:hypothetical protein
MAGFIVGKNMPGCLPDSPDDVSIFDTKQEAIGYLVSEVEGEWDDVENGDNTRHTASITEECMNAHTALHNDPAIPFVAYIDGYNYWIELYTDNDAGYGECMACGHTGVLAFNEAGEEYVKHLDANHADVCDTCTGGDPA